MTYKKRQKIGGERPIDEKVRNFPSYGVWVGGAEGGASGGEKDISVGGWRLVLYE